MKWYKNAGNYFPAFFLGRKFEPDVLNFVKIELIASVYAYF